MITHICKYNTPGFILELSFSKSGGVQAGYILILCGIFYFPGIHTRLNLKGPTAFNVFSKRQVLAKWDKQNCQSSEVRWHQQDSNSGASGYQPCALTHSASIPQIGLKHTLSMSCFVSFQKLLWTFMFSSVAY